MILIFLPRSSMLNFPSLLKARKILHKGVTPDLSTGLAPPTVLNVFLV